MCARQTIASGGGSVASAGGPLPAPAPLAIAHAPLRPLFPVTDDDIAPLVRAMGAYSGLLGRQPQDDPCMPGVVAISAASRTLALAVALVMNRWVSDLLPNQGKRLG